MYGMLMLFWCRFTWLMLLDVLCDQKVVFLPKPLWMTIWYTLHGVKQVLIIYDRISKMCKICESHPAGGLCPANIVTPPAYCRNDMAKHQSISGEDGDQQLCSKSLTATSVVEVFPVTSIDRNLDVHRTSVQYFFNEDRWFWYFDIKPFLRIRISQTSDKHRNIWLWSSTRKHYNLKIEIDISDCAPRLEPGTIYTLANVPTLSHIFNGYPRSLRMKISSSSAKTWRVFIVSWMHCLRSDLPHCR